MPRISAIGVERACRRDVRRNWVRPDDGRAFQQDRVGHHRCLRRAMGDSRKSGHAGRGWSRSRRARRGRTATMGHGAPIAFADLVADTASRSAVTNQMDPVGLSGTGQSGLRIGRASGYSEATTVHVRDPDQRVRRPGGPRAWRTTRRADDAHTCRRLPVSLGQHAGRRGRDPSPGGASVRSRSSTVAALRRTGVDSQNRRDSLAPDRLCVACPSGEHFGSSQRGVGLRLRAASRPCGPRSTDENALR